ncbi:MAG: hypothetical protein WA317_01515 [Mycobacterium sp.]|uniref:hypothetical protein n=1 Tax=Mycobacterium sp. TaxID=1785 RepID=UPI003CC587EE
MTPREAIDMTTMIRIRVPNTGEHIDDGTDEWRGESLDSISLSAADLGCEPGTAYILELVDDETKNVLESLDTVAS